MAKRYEAPHITPVGSLHARTLVTVKHDFKSPDGVVFQGAKGGELFLTS
jgi:hypothetical protein